MPAAAVIPAPIAYINGVEMPYADVAHLCSTCSTGNGCRVAQGETYLDNPQGLSMCNVGFFCAFGCQHRQPIRTTLFGCPLWVAHLVVHFG